MGSQMGDLQNWAGEILGECQQYLVGCSFDHNC